jgi:hypothetical protein
MKGGGSREPQPFTSVDPLFYLSSFQPLLAESRCPEAAAFCVSLKYFGDYVHLHRFRFLKIAQMISSIWYNSRPLSILIPNFTEI